MGFIDQEDPASRFSFANAVSLLSGQDFWHTSKNEPLGLGCLKFSDGPNGVRGEDWINGAPSAAIPCATALGASFGIDLTAQLARLLAEECKRKGVHCLLAPTMNIHRNPLCGRNFESFSEDPMLSGVIASAFTQGLQGQGISASPKHFLANEAENGRRWRDSVISERAMREIYLEPFRIVVELGNPWCIMTAYNSVNGSFCSESEDLLSILRNEWCYAGVVISDWFGTYSTAAAFTAGLDIEMLGPTKFRSQGAILEALKQGDITNHQITNSTARVLDLLRKTGRVGTPGAAPLPKAEEPHYLDDPKSRNLLRHAAEASIVLLKNEKGTLPLVERHSRLTVFGRHAKEPALFGGGSASLKVPYTSTPWEAIQRSFLGASYGSGVAIERLVPLPNESRLKLGEITLDWYNGDQPSTDNRFFSQTLKDTLYMLVEHAPDGLVDRSNFCTSMTFDFTARNTGFYDLSLCGPGNAKCTVDENVVLEVQRDLKVSTEDFLFDRSKLDVVRARPLPCTTTLSTTPPFRQAKKKIYY
ncbi:Beta-glucosidase [Fusarium sp. Ph1]|nr:Beta-glucosidase [Fusarium sp. Ph1]